MLSKFSFIAILSLFIAVAFTPVTAQTAKGKKISSDLFGLFFEDINYAADGGLYAELVQNRSFEYSPTDKRNWHPFSFWQYITPGYSYGSLQIETSDPVHSNNPHYAVLNIEHTGDTGIGLKNSGFDYMLIKKGEQYLFSVFAKELQQTPIELWISLQNPNGELLAAETIQVNGADWKKYETTLLASSSSDSASLVLIAKTKGKLALDLVSLFPANTFKKRTNGLRNDLAVLLQDLQPKFIRFPGGCLVHGDGLGNMYRWKNTIGPLEQRVEQKNIWGYHQTAGLGYFEYFQFCEDIGAKPIPVLPAAVSCQNSGGTWRIGGTGQKALPLEEMDEYIQEVLDLIEWATGPATSTRGAKRAAAGHPEPFALEYIGIGNEDKITAEFEERFLLINDAIKKKYPNIKIIGTSGPGEKGEDFEKGWKLAHQHELKYIDEHYYLQPGWFIANQHRYDSYPRNKAAVYIGEYASWGNKLFNALAEAIYMTSLERNGDIVQLASYAPLLAKNNFTQWNPDMIYFDNSRTYPTINYYVQQLFSTNQGALYYKDIVQFNRPDSALAASCVKDTKSGDLIIKIVNATEKPEQANIRLAGFKNLASSATQTILTGDRNAENKFGVSPAVLPVSSTLAITKKMQQQVPPMSMTVIRIKKAS